MPTLFPESRLYFARHIHGYLERQRHTPLGTLARAITQNEDYGSEVARLEQIVLNHRGRRAPRRRRRHEQDSIPEAVYNTAPPSSQPVEEQMQHLNVRDSKNLPQPESTGEDDGPKIRQPPGDQFHGQTVEGSGGHLQPRRRGLRAFIAEQALRILEESQRPQPPQRQRSRLTRQDRTDRGRLERTRSEPHRRPRDREPERHASLRIPRRSREHQSEHRTRRTGEHRTRRNDHDASRRIRSRRDPRRSGGTQDPHYEDGSSVPMMSGALPPQSQDSLFVNQHFSASSSPNDPPDDGLTFGDTPCEEIHPDESASRTVTPEPPPIPSIPIRNFKRDTTAGVVNGDWGWKDSARREDSAVAVAMTVAPPELQSPKRTVSVNTNAALERYGSLTSEQQRQKAKRERIMRAAEIMGKGKGKKDQEDEEGEQSQK